MDTREPRSAAYRDVLVWRVCRGLNQILVDGYGQRKRRALRPVFAVLNQWRLFTWLVGAFDFIEHEVGDDLRARKFDVERTVGIFPGGTDAFIGCLLACSFADLRYEAGFPGFRGDLVFMVLLLFA